MNCLVRLSYLKFLSVLIITVTTKHDINGVSLKSNFVCRVAFLTLQAEFYNENQFCVRFILMHVVSNLREDEKSTCCISWFVHIFAFISNLQITKRMALCHDPCGAK